MLSDHSRKPARGNHSQPAAHQLHSRHHRERSNRSPEQTVAEHCARHGIGRDPRRVVIRAACNQAGAEVGKKTGGNDLLSAMPRSSIVPHPALMIAWSAALPAVTEEREARWPGAPKDGSLAQPSRR